MNTHVLQINGTEEGPVTMSQLKVVLSEVLAVNNSLLYKVIETNNKKLRKELKKDRDDAFDEFALSIGKNFNAIDDKFKAIDEKFNKIDIRFNKIDTKLAGMDSRIRGINSRMDHFAEHYLTRAEYTKGKI